MDITRTIEIFEAIQRDLVPVSGEGIIDRKDAVINLNQSQLLQGQKSDGTGLGTYRPFTVAKRQEKGRQTAFVDLFYEGDFQDKMDLRVDGNQYSFFSTDSKSEKLQDKYGDNIFGLNIENRYRAWNEFIQPYVVRNLASRYNLNIVNQ